MAFLYAFGVGYFFAHFTKLSGVSHTGRMKENHENQIKFLSGQVQKKDKTINELRNPRSADTEKESSGPLLISLCSSISPPDKKGLTFEDLSENPDLMDKWLNHLDSKDDE